MNGSFFVVSNFYYYSYYSVPFHLLFTLRVSGERGEFGWGDKTQLAQRWVLRVLPTKQKNRHKRFSIFIIFFFSFFLHNNNTITFYTLVALIIFAGWEGRGGDNNRSIKQNRRERRSRDHGGDQFFKEIGEVRRGRATSSLAARRRTTRSRSPSWENRGVIMRQRERARENKNENINNDNSKYNYTKYII